MDLRCLHAHLPALERAAGALLVAAAILIGLGTFDAPTPAVSADRPAPGAAATATGTLYGTVQLGPRLAARRIHVSLYPAASRPVAPPPDTSLSAQLGNVVVYLEDSPALHDARDPRRGPFQVEQTGESFVPHVLPIVAGTTVEFPNGDPIYHNVFSLSKAASFDLGRFPRGSSRSVRFDQPGIVKVFCHIHADMSAVILVLEHPFFATPDARGAFSIEGIAPGRYTATGWHERARPIHHEVTIEPGGRTEISLAIPLQDEADGR
jgi:plastocyanin